MKLSLRGFLAGWLLVALAPACLAQVTVCGVQLDPASPLGWNSASEAAAGDQRVAYRVLTARYESAATHWPDDLARNAATAFSELRDLRLFPADFAVTKDPVDMFGRRQGAFFGKPYAVDLPVNADSPLCQPEAVRQARIELASVIAAVGAADAQDIAIESRVLSERIQTLEAKFDRYLFEGFPMFPWEAAVNSWFLTDKRIANGPPRNQLVVMHPAAGILASVAKDARSDTGSTLSIEPLGWVHYTADYRHWMGVSVLAVFPGDRDAGFGFALNYDEYKLGVTWHDDDTGVHDGAAVFLGIDLYKFLSAKYRKVDTYRGKLRKLGLGK